MKSVATQSLLYDMSYLLINVATWGTYGTMVYLAPGELDSLGTQYWVTLLANFVFTGARILLILNMYPTYILQLVVNNSSSCKNDNNNNGGISMITIPVVMLKLYQRRIAIQDGQLYAMIFGDHRH